VAPLSFEREVLSILVEEPALAGEFADRIPPGRFGNQVYRRIYERIVEGAGGVRDTAGLYSLFADDRASLEVLTALGQSDRSSTVRYGSPGERREHLERVVDRLQLEDVRKRYQELSHLIDELATARHPVPTELRGEFDALATKLKK
jgi:hypothetical protein